MTLDLPALRGEIRRKDTTPERLLEIAALDPQLSRSVAKARTTPPAVLDKLAHSRDMPTRARVAEHPATSAPTLAHLAADPQWTVLKAAAENPNLPADILLKLTRHKRSTVRAAAVRAGLERGLFGPGELQQLFSDPGGEVQAELAAWKGLDMAGIRALLGVTSSAGQVVILQRQVGSYTHNLTRSPEPLPAPLTPADLLPLLDSGDGEVQALSIRSLRTLNFDFLTLPLARREVLASTQHEPVNDAIIKLWEQWFAGNEAGARERALAVLRTSSNAAVKMKAFRLTDEQTLLSYAASPREEERAEVAARVRDPATLQKLAQDASDNVRSYLLYNPHLSRELLWQLVGSLDLSERRPYQILPLQKPRVFGNPNLTEQDWAALLADDGPLLPQLVRQLDLSAWSGGDHEVLARIVSQLSHSHLPQVLSAILTFHNTPQGRAALKESIQQHAPELLPRYQSLYER